MTLNNLEHIHKRKRKYTKNIKKYPNTDPKIKRLDDFMLAIAAIAPFFLLPQIIKVYAEKDASGISGLTFGLLASTHIAWIVYGVVHKERQILTAHILFFIATLSLLLGTIIF